MGTPEFVNCVFRNNGTGTGDAARPYGAGGVWVHTGSPKFTNCLFHDNVAWEGGGIVSVMGSATLVNCTITENSAHVGDGGGIHDWLGATTIQNTIVWNNSAARNSPQVYRPSEPAATITYSNIQGGWTGTGNINSDPLFTNPGSNIFTIPVLSPRKDVGGNALLPADVADLDWDNNTTEGLPKDLAGNNRKIQFNLDMGAYEGPASVE